MSRCFIWVSAALKPPISGAGAASQHQWVSGAALAAPPGLFTQLSLQLPLDASAAAQGDRLAGCTGSSG